MLSSQVYVPNVCLHKNLKHVIVEWCFFQQAENAFFSVAHISLDYRERERDLGKKRVKIVSLLGFLVHVMLIYRQNSQERYDFKSHLSKFELNSVFTC